MVSTTPRQHHGTAEAIQDGISFARAGQNDILHHFQRLLTRVFVLGWFDSGKIPDVGEGPAGCGVEGAASLFVFGLRLLVFRFQVFIGTRNIQRAQEFLWPCPLFLILGNDEFFGSIEFPIIRYFAYE